MSNSITAAVHTYGNLAREDHLYTITAKSAHGCQHQCRHSPLTCSAASVSALLAGSSFSAGAGPLLPPQRTSLLVVALMAPLPRRGSTTSTGRSPVSCVRSFSRTCSSSSNSAAATACRRYIRGQGGLVTCMVQSASARTTCTLRGTAPQRCRTVLFDAARRMFAQAAEPAHLIVPPAAQQHLARCCVQRAGADEGRVMPGAVSHLNHCRHGGSSSSRRSN